MEDEVELRGMMLSVDGAKSLIDACHAELEGA
jgi:hypothetical protein